MNIVTNSIFFFSLFTWTYKIIIIKKKNFYFLFFIFFRLLQHQWLDLARQRIMLENGFRLMAAAQSRSGEEDAHFLREMGRDAEMGYTE